MRKDRPFSFVNKDKAVLPWGPEVIDITEVTKRRGGGELYNVMTEFNIILYYIIILLLYYYYMILLLLLLLYYYYILLYYYIILLLLLLYYYIIILYYYLEIFIYYTCYTVRNYRKSGRKECILFINDERLHGIFRWGGRLLNCIDPLYENFRLQ